VSDEQRDDTIRVKSANPEKVGVWERDPAHPDGEVYVAGDAVVEVAQTALVLEKLRNRELVEVTGTRRGRKADDQE
jgi:hypothetical protein